MRFTARSLGFLLFLGCGTSASDPAPLTSEGLPVLEVSGTEGVPIQAKNVADILVVDVTVNGVTAPIGVDTGSPVILLGPSGFPNAGLPNGVGTVDSMTIGALGFKNAYVVAADLITSPDSASPLYGLLGCQILCNFAVSFNYRDEQLTLGKGTMPAGLETSDVAVPFSLLGGGEGSLAGVGGSVHIPKSRIVLKAIVEGAERTFMVDSGASVWLLKKAVFSELVKDGRATIGGIETTIVGGTTSVSITRLKAASIGGEEVNGILASQDPTFEKTLNAVESEVGVSLDGLIGGSFLRHFFVTIDYPSTTMHLRRYATGAPTFDGMDRIAFSVSDQGLVDAVIQGSQAEELGVTVGDEVINIDGKAIDADDLTVSGPVGTSKMVRFGKTSAASLSNQTVAIPIEDILPLAKAN